MSDDADAIASRQRAVWRAPIVTTTTVCTGRIRPPADAIDASNYDSTRQGVKPEFCRSRSVRTRPRSRSADLRVVCEVSHALTREIDEYAGSEPAGRSGARIGRPRRGVLTNMLLEDTHDRVRRPSDEQHLTSCLSHD